ncbi:MAG: TonB-dependent receptor [Saprospiraceae bacterium]|nr:TonB-dependent receptor [Saprospiraceae bacterium]MDW8484229.1 TonB-dependent receptor [Saprospiraceae bacterium]
MIAQIVRVWGAVSLVFSSSLWLGAQHCDIPLRGMVWDADTGEPLAFAAVRVIGTHRGALTDETGAFLIPDLCEDSLYTVVVSHIACEHERQVIRLLENQVFHFYLRHHVLKEVVVQAQAAAPMPIQALETLSGESLAPRQSLPLGEALRDLAGVSVLNTGTTIAKPVIHGLHSNRIVIVAHGVPLEGQQWGAEHAPEIDPFSAQRISVVKGAAGVRYGIGAMAGAIVVEPASLRQQPGMSGWLYGGLHSNGWSGVLAGSADWKASRRALALRLQGSVKRSGNLRAPDYWLGNTGLAEMNFAITAEGKTGAWRHETVISRFSQRIGILQAAHVGNLTDLRRAIESQSPLNNDNRFTFDIGRPFQRIHHYMVRHRASRSLAEKWKCSTQYALQFNRREEYDIVRRTDNLSTKPQQRFRIWTHMLDVALKHLPISHWEGGLGAQLLYQYNLVGRGGLIPDYQSWGASLWWLERWRHFPKPWEVELGLRADYRRTAAKTTGAFYNVDTTVHFGGVSANLGVARLFGAYMRLMLHTGYAWRPPHVNELFARGVHHGAATYEEGRPDLKAERSWNTHLSAQYRRQRIQATLTLFSNRVKNFIYLDPQRTFVLTSRGAFPAYFYTQADAVLSGVDVSLSLPLIGALHIEGHASLLRAYRFLSDSAEGPSPRDWLPLMPADRFQYGLSWSKPESSASQTPSTLVRILATTTLRQTRIPASGLLSNAPPAFTLWSAEIAHAFRAKKSRQRYLEAGLMVRNLTNVRYREYLNFFRFFTDEPGTNISIWSKWHF